MREVVGLRTQPPVLGGYALRDSLHRINERQDAFHLEFGTPGSTDPDVTRGWHRCADLLADPAGFDRWHTTLRAWLTAEFGEAPNRTAAGYVKSWYLQVPATLAALLFHYERRVPSLQPDDLGFRIAADGRPHPDAIAVRAAGFACLPDDPAAGTSGATVVSSDERLADLLRARYVPHAAQFVAAYQPPVHFGRHAMWATATDAIDAAIWKTGKQGGDVGAAVADAALVLPDRIEPFTSASTLHPIRDGSGDITWTRRKETCCFTYLLTKGKGACATCPRRSPPLT